MNFFYSDRVYIIYS